MTSSSGGCPKRFEFPAGPDPLHDRFHLSLVLFEELDRLRSEFLALLPSPVDRRALLDRHVLDRVFPTEEGDVLVPSGNSRRRHEVRPELELCRYLVQMSCQDALHNGLLFLPQSSPPSRDSFCVTHTPWAIQDGLTRNLSEYSRLRKGISRFQFQEPSGTISPPTTNN